MSVHAPVRIAVSVSVWVCECVCARARPVLLGLVWPTLTPVACFPAAPPSFSVSVDSGRDRQTSFRISWLGRSGALKKEQLCPEVITEGSGLCSALWCPRP